MGTTQEEESTDLLQLSCYVPLCLSAWENHWHPLILLEFTALCTSAPCPQRSSELCDAGQLTKWTFSYQQRIMFQKANLN